MRKYCQTKNTNQTNKRTFYITLDTEMDADKHWVKSSTPQFTSILIGIPKYLRPLWDKCEVNPIYFVSPEVVKNSKCCEVLKEEIKKGAIIGAHLHPEYIEPYTKCNKKNKKIEAQFPCFDCDTESETQKIRNLTELIQNKLGVRPIWYRAARFGADKDTISILEKLEYKYDSSVTPYINWSKKGGPDHSSSPLSPYMVNSNNMYSNNNNGQIKEYPITILNKRFGFIGKILPNNWLFYNWLRPTHMFLWEQKIIIRRARHCKLNDLVLMFHSMEIMINKTPYVRNKFMQKYFLWRLEKTILYMKKCGYKSIK